MNSKRPVICILGPTGAGKTATSLGMAKSFTTKIVNFDSRQVYEDFPVVTAQPSKEEQAVCAHELYGFLPTDQILNVAGFVDLAKKTIDETANDQQIVMVGGTGMYLQALTSGLAPIPDIPDDIRQSVRERAEKMGSPALFEELEKIDPEYAKRTHPNNRQRNSRAIEVYEATGKNFTWWHNREVPPSKYDFLKVGIKMDLDELTPQLNKRIDIMLNQGALQEIKQAWEKCPDIDAAGWTGIGCNELLRFILGEISLDEACDLWRKNTRAYAKRQLTWFNREKDIKWFRPDEHEAAVMYAKEWLAQNYW